MLFPDSVTFTVDFDKNYTIILTVLKLDGSVDEQYISPGYIIAGAKDAATVTDTTTCYKVGSTLESMIGYNGTVIGTDIRELDYYKFNETAFRVNVTSALAGSETNPACTNARLLWCHVAAFNDLDTPHMIRN